MNKKRQRNKSTVCCCQQNPFRAQLFFLCLLKPPAGVSKKFHLMHFVLMKYPWCHNNENDNGDDNNNDHFTDS